MDTLKMLFKIDRVEESFDAKRTFTVVDSFLVCFLHVFHKLSGRCEKRLTIWTHFSVVTVES